MTIRSPGLSSTQDTGCGGAYVNIQNYNRADDGVADNSIRHLFTYVDTTSNPQDGSRCNLCCWGADRCQGKYETFAFLVRG